MDLLPDDDHYRQVLGFLRESSPELADELEHLDEAELESLSPPSIPDYEPIEVIGTGNFGVVWLVKNSVDFQFYALKVLREGIQAELEGVREWKRLITYHPHLVSIGHVGVNDGVYYYVMQLADNAFGDRSLDQPGNYRAMTLVEYVQQKGRLTGEETIEIGRQIASGLQTLHEANAVHRDVKPANIVRFAGQWRLADVGFVTSDARSATAGSKGYRSPSLPEDFTQDLHALAVSMHQVSRRSDSSEASRRVAQALARASSNDATDRFLSARELSQFLVGSPASDSAKKSNGTLLATLALVLLASVCWVAWIAKKSGNESPASSDAGNRRTSQPTPAETELGLANGEGFPAHYPILNLYLASDPISDSMPLFPASSVTVPRAWYVSTDGSDENSGSDTDEFRTISHGVSVLRPGDSLIVRDGEYHDEFIQVRNHRGSVGQGFGLWGDKNHVTRIKAENPHGAHIFGQFLVRGSWITIEGFRIETRCEDDENGIPTNAQPSIKAEWSHHIDVINNKVGPAAGGGILFNFSDWLRIVGNEVHRTGTHNVDCHNGISVYQPFAMVADRSGRRWGIEISNNKSVGNYNHESTNQTGGNGIACTDFLYAETHWGAWQNESLLKAQRALNPAGRLYAPKSGYPRRTLVANNLCAENGNSGIQLYLAKSVSLDGNRCVRNGQNVATSKCAELFVSDSRDCSITSNRLVAEGKRFAVMYTDLVGEIDSAGNSWEENMLWNTDGSNPVSGAQDLVEAIDISPSGTNRVEPLELDLKLDQKKDSDSTDQ